jgi:hypothetical protein
VQDHPSQWRYFETWTPLAYAAGRTDRVPADPVGFVRRLGEDVAPRVRRLLE